MSNIQARHKKRHHSNKLLFTPCPDLVSLFSVQLNAVTNSPHLHNLWVNVTHKCCFYLIYRAFTHSSQASVTTSQEFIPHYHFHRKLASTCTSTMFIMISFSIASLCTVFVFYKHQETEAEPAMTFPESTLAQTESGPCTNTTGFGAGTDDIIVCLEQNVDFTVALTWQKVKYMYLVSGFITSSNTRQSAFNYVECSFYIVKLCSKGEFTGYNLQFQPQCISFPRTGLVFSKDICINL